MEVLIWFIAFLLNLSLLWFYNASKQVQAISSVIFISALLALTHSAAMTWLYTAIVIAAIFTVVFVKPIRCFLIIKPLFSLFQKKLPRLSATEQQAMTAGTIAWDGELFSGHPNIETLLSYPKAVLTQAEQDFLDGSVEKLCSMLDQWKIQYEDGDMPEEVWRFIKDNGFLGLIIPKHYGGKEFSAYAHSRVIMKIASVSPVAAVTVSVPNSLGPAELLLHYGTQQQKDYYLPRLARGEEIPCFALTSPVAGSDATSIIDSGIVCEQTIDGKKVLGMRLTWNKRYITLAPIATLIGLAFKLYDPDHLLGQQEELGITCALIPRDTLGVDIGRRHLPNQMMFQNGPTQGHDVFLPLDNIIGGKEQIGNGWKMLVECLSAGRAISIPSMSMGGLKVASLYGGAYATIRQQFKHSLVDFQGVQAALAQSFGVTYIADAAEELATSLIAEGERPSVISAILKYQVTEMSRSAILNTMDILAGKGLCLGANNPITSYYLTVPIAITVEGASILTRCLVIFGQGLFRCHPYLLQEMTLAQKGKDKATITQFDTVFLAHIKHILHLTARSFWGGLSNGKMLTVDNDIPLLQKPLQSLQRYSAAFALLADSLAILYGGNLKRKEFISGRMADILNYLVCVSAVIKKFHDDGMMADEVPLFMWSYEKLFYDIQESLMAILGNLPWYFRVKLRSILFPLGRQATPPGDELEATLAEMGCQPSKLRQRLIHGAYTTSSANHPSARMNEILKVFSDTEDLWKKFLKYAKTLSDPSYSWQDKINLAQKEGVLTQEEAAQLQQRELYRQEAIQVADYDAKEFAGFILDKAKMQE